MANYITKIRTDSGDKQIDYNALANLPESATSSKDGLMSKEDKNIFDAFGFYTSGSNAEMLTTNNISVQTPRILIDAEEPIRIVTGGKYTTVSAAEIVDMKNEVGAKAALANYVPTSQKGKANGVASLDANGKVPSTQLPSYVDDVLEYSAKSSFPTTGETGKIYVDTTTNKTYRWSGSAYIEISASLALGETSSTAYAGDKGKALKEAVDNISNVLSNSNHVTTLGTDNNSSVYLELKNDTFTARGTEASIIAEEDLWIGSDADAKLGFTTGGGFTFVDGSGTIGSATLDTVTINNMKNEIGAKANAFGNANATTYATKYGPAYGGINTTSTGQASTAIGAGVTACSDGAFAAGVLTIAGNPESYTDAKYSGQGAAAFGISNPSQGKFGARGMASFVAGYNTYAKANATAAFGDSTKALGEASFTAGYLTIAEGNQSFATGRQTQALGNSSAVFGKETVAHASASGALVAGLRCHAYVDGAVVLGDSLVGTQNVSNMGQVVLGRYNKIENNSTDVFVVGCGSSASSRKNGFAVTSAGNAVVSGTITVDGETFTAADIRKMKAFLATIAD